MKSAARGNGTSDPEVTNVTRQGLWLLWDREELFLPFEQFPWFKNAPIGKVLHVEKSSAQHAYWPDLDIDLALDCIRHPERFPLVSNVAT